MGMKIEAVISKEHINNCCTQAVEQTQYTFALSAKLHLVGVFNNGQPVEGVEAEECEMAFRPAMKKYTVKGLHSGELCISYGGVPEGYFLFMQDELIHMSLYNGWYPVGFDVTEEYDIFLTCDDCYQMINAEYCNESHKWFYSTRGQKIADCNLMLINKELAYSRQSSKVDIFYFDSKRSEYVESFFQSYGKICDFYRKLYGMDKLQHLTIVFLPEKENIGAYKRDKLIVFSHIDPDLERSLHTLAHEAAHAYAVGADTNTFEDWLNETHAEWSALLYELDHNPAILDRLIEEKRQDNGNASYSLKPCGEGRPDNVHEAGTLLYYEIYMKYGKNVISELLKIFDSLEEKTTAVFIEKIKALHPEVAEMIEAQCR